MDNSPNHTVEKDNPLLPGQKCVALLDFEGQEEGDLPFSEGEFLTIVEPCKLMFWYIAKNAGGHTGIVPRNFLSAVEAPEDERGQREVEAEEKGSGLQQEDASSTAAATTHNLPTTSNTSSYEDLLQDDYIAMQPNAAPSPLAPKPVKANPVDREVLIIQQKERRRRLPAGTLVVGSCNFPGEEEGDLPFKVYDEMVILEALPDLCWYRAHKTDNPDVQGAIPVTHVRLVYMSDDEDEGDVYTAPSKPAHEQLYEDTDEFISQSGWYSCAGLAHGRPALLHVLAKKSHLTYERFMSINQAVYKIEYRNGEKVYIGKATKILHEELCQHFDCFGKRREDIREIDDELCHHTDAAGWEITVWPVGPRQNLEVEWCKTIIEHDSLRAKEKGLNEDMKFSSMTDFDQFWQWFSPN